MVATGCLGGVSQQRRECWQTVAMSDLDPADVDRPVVHQLRVVVTATDYDEAIHFYRDVLGLTEEAAFSSPDGRVVILDAGRATLEIADPGHAAFIDQVEVGRRIAGHIRLAFEVDDTPSATARLAAAGGTVVAPPVRTPWQSINSRLEGPAGLQLTLFSEGGGEAP
jgi:lactoylglutathione lyase